MRYKNLKAETGFEVAIVGMACRFPGAGNPGEFWKNLLEKKESITFFDLQEIAENVPAEFPIGDKNYVPASGYLAEPDFFDAPFFEFSNKEASLLDPQIRLFLECSWEALEDSGYVNKVAENRVGVFGTASDNLLWQMATSLSASKLQSEYYLASILNNKDFLSTIASYKLNLTGSSLNLSTACSSSLVAVHLACQNLLSGNVDLGIAGGVCINFPFKQGYVYQEGMILSADGHCRSFDINASGTVGGNGCGVVLLKMLDRALEDNDHIYAVIKGSAVNNDGIRKIGFTAPSIDGQAEVIADAHYMAGVEPESIGYLEAHGSGTKIGDQIEIAALKKAFNSQKRNFCAVGSVKPNIGHLDTAAGIAGLIKAVLCLKNRKLPGNLHFETPNEGIDFEQSPFYINVSTTDFLPVGDNPLRVGVSSFGISGTNAHLVLEEAPRETAPPEEEDFSLLLLSGKTRKSLLAGAAEYREYFMEKDLRFADAAYTTRTGRKHFGLRHFIICRHKNEAIAQLAADDFESGSSRMIYPEKDRRILLLFSPGWSDAPEGRGYATLLQDLTGCKCEIIPPGEAEAVAGDLARRKDIVSLILEIGPSPGFQKTCTEIAGKNDAILYAHLPDAAGESLSERRFILHSAGVLWKSGFHILWDKIDGDKELRIIPLPTYAFDRTRYTMKLESITLQNETPSAIPADNQDYAFYERVWESRPGTGSRFAGMDGKTMVIFLDTPGLREPFLKILEKHGCHSIVVKKGKAFYKENNTEYTIRENNFEDYAQLLSLLEREKRGISGYVYLFSLSGKPDTLTEDLPRDAVANSHYYSLLHLARALGYLEASNKHIKKLFVISNNLHCPVGSEKVLLDRAGMLALIRCIPFEFPLVKLKAVDFDFFSQSVNFDLIAWQIAAELAGREEDVPVAYRGNRRYTETFRGVEARKYEPDSPGGSSGWNIIFCAEDIPEIPCLSFVASLWREPGAGKRKLTLVTRGHGDEMRAAVELVAPGIEVEVLPCDFFVKQELDSLLDALPREPVDGIFCTGLVREDEYARFIIEGHDENREEAYTRKKWSFVLNLHHGIRNRDYRLVLFFLPGRLHTGKEANSLAAGLVQGITGFCAQTGFDGAKKWCALFSYPGAGLREEGAEIPAVVWDGSATEIILSPSRPSELSARSKKSEDELFNIFLEHRRPVKEVFYKPAWIQRDNINLTCGAQEKICMLFSGNGAHGRMLEKIFSARFRNLIIVREGAGFSRDAESNYTIDSSAHEDYDSLFDSVQSARGLPEVIIHAYNFNNSPHISCGGMEKDLDRGLYSLLNIARSMGRFDAVTRTVICSLTNNIVKVLDSDRINPAKAPVLGAVKVIPFEYPTFSCVNIDLDAENEEECRGILDSLLVDLELAGEFFSVFAYRCGRRYIERFEPCYPAPESDWVPLLKEKGIYLITGGFGGMGFTIACFLAETRRARCVLVGRSPFPPASAWKEYAGEDKKTAAFIKRMLELEDLGAEFLVVPTDITDSDQVDLLEQKVRQRWAAPPDGIIHTAGLVDYNGIIQNRPREKTAEVAAPKIQGTVNLDRAFSPHNPDFFLLCSSIGDIIPASKVGEIGYSAGNEFLDAYTHYRCDEGAKFITINWNDWSEVGMSVDSHYKRFEGKDFVPEFDEPIATKPEQGVAAFYHVLHMNQRRIVISPYDLSSLILKDAEMNYIRMTKNYLNPAEVGQSGAEEEESGLLNKTEMKMLDIYKDLFRTEDIGLDDNFFDIGGDSLMAMSILSYIHAHFDVKLPVDKFFNQPTIRDVAGTIDTLSRKKFTAIAKAGLKEYYPLSPAQERMFITDRIYREMALTTYNEPHIVRLRGRVDTRRVEQTFRKILERHESFRTSYHFVDEVPVQKIHEAVDFKLAIIETRRDSVTSALRDFIKPFDLSVPPLVRAGLLRVAEDDWILIIDKHHITCDGLSNQTVFNDFVALYRGRELPKPALQYVDYSEWYHHTYRESMQIEHERFWLDVFRDGVPELKLPYDHKKKSASLFRGALLDFELTAPQSEKFTRVFSGTDTTRFVIILSIYSLLLARISGQRDFVIGSPVSGRWHKDVQSIVGMFVNMLSFRVRLKEEISFLDFLAEQKESYPVFLENQYYPFDLLVKKIVKKRDVLENPIFNVSLEQHSFNNPDSNAEDEIGDFRLEPFELPGENITARFDLSLLYGEKDGRIAFRFLYARDLFAESTIRECRESLMAIIAEILENPQIPLRSLITPEMPPLPEIRQGEPGAPVLRAEASSHQERLWFIDSFEADNLYKGSPVYHNIPAPVFLDFMPELPLLQKTVDAVFNKYDALCTTIHTEAYKPVQVITKPAAFPLEVRDEVFDENNREEWMPLLSREAGIPFVLDQVPLCRVILFRHGEQKALLLLVAHHAVCDSYGLKLLLGELVDTYRAGGIVRAGEESLRYSDYSRWQNSIPGDVRKRLLMFWEKTLRDKVKPLELYTDFPRAEVHVYKAGFRNFVLDEEITERIKKPVGCGAVEPATLFMAAFMAFLYRYSGAGNITIGNMTDNRKRKKLEALIGPLARLLIISLDVTAEMTYAELVSALDGYLKALESYADIPFESIVSHINPRKDMSRTALFDILFRYSDASPAPPAYNTPDTNLGLGKYDLNLLIEKKDTHFTGTLVYNALYYTDETIQRMLRHFTVFLKGLLSEPRRDLASCPLIAGKEKEALLRVQKNTEAAYPRDPNLFEAFSQQVAKTPHKTALTFQEHSLSYRELEQLSVNLSDYLLAEYRIQPGGIVALLMRNSEWMIVAMLAVLRCGGCYLPVNPENPADRVRYYLKDSQCELLITDQEIDREEVAGQAYDVLDIRVYADNPPRALPSAFTPPEQTEPAYMIYTSGTTGNPKGCLVTHRNVVRLILNEDLPFRFDAEDRWIMAHAGSFDFSVWEIFGSLLTGGQLVIPELEEIRNVEKFVQLVKRNRITVLNQTPGAFSAFMLVEKKTGEPELQQHLRYVLFGGARLEPYRLRDWIRRYPLRDIVLCNLYGITETTVHTTYHFLREDEITSSASLSNIGGPLPETEVYILNDKLEPVPRGVTGEIYVGGSGVSAGYWQRPALTDKVFINSPFHAGERLYKSGDLGRWISENEILYEGRKDRQVKVRGYRIELGEIENLLTDLEGISRAHVLQHRETEKLCAYFVADLKLKPESLKEYLSRHLPEYMIPSYFMQLDEIPLTGNHKIDSRALPSPEEHYVSDKEFVLPGNETEEKIRDIIKDLLKIKNVSVMDNYFDIGVDSLMLIQMNSRLQEEFGLNLPLMELFKHTTISQLAEFIISRASTYEFNYDKAQQVAKSVSKLGMIKNRLKTGNEEL